MTSPQREQYANLRTLRAEVKFLREALDQARSEASATKNKHKRWEGDINTKLRLVREERKTLEEEIARVREELSVAETLEPQVNKASDLEHRVEQLTEQLILWYVGG
ncbi:MAG: hypothetical protein BJ554DRAFT_1694 [Olpidium bornovanus]|uniref:Uncharacterized protein n=1 Tax=Olpidium bornovanus TaxID=278681 RepID=A0A8H7ZRM0_9FUNG|nr:MAG: hypothetical protein BJ554DRAFT_1694 [Olpidium bornovanus]